MTDKIQNGEKLTLVPEGRLDTTAAPQFQQILIPAFDEAKQVELDFTKLVYISSAGLRVLLMGQKTASAKGAAMTIRGVPDDIMEVFEMTGFTDILDIARG